MKYFTFSILVLFYSSLLSQPVWQNTSITMSNGDRHMIVLGDDCYYITENASFQKQHLPTGLVTDLADLPSPGINILYSSHFVTDEFIYIFYRYNMSSYFAKYDLAGDHWTSLPTLPSINSTYQNQITFQTSTAFYAATTNSEILNRFDYLSETWTSDLTIPNIANQRYAYTKDGKGRIIYLTGEVWEFDDTDTTWTLAQSDIPGFLNLSSTGNWSTRFAYDEWFIYTGAGVTYIYNLALKTKNIITDSSPGRVFLWNNEVYHKTGTTVKKLVLCQPPNDLYILTEGLHYRNTRLFPEHNINYVPPTTSIPSSKTWYFNGEQLINNSVREVGQDLVGDEHEIVSEIQLGVCTFTDTSHIQLAPGYWSPITGLPYDAPERAYAVGFGLENFAYMGLGRTTSGAALKDMWRMDYSTKELIPVADFPGAARYHASYITHNNMGYIVGGQPTAIANEFWRFNPENETWTQLQNLPAVTILNGTCFIHEEKLYAGLTPNGQFCIYDFETESWSLGPTVPNTTTVWDIQSFVINDVPYLIVYNNNSRKLYKLTDTGVVLVKQGFLPGISTFYVWVTQLADDHVMISGLPETYSMFSRDYLFFPETNLLTSGPTIICGNSNECEWARIGTTVFSNGNSRYVAFGYNSNFWDLSTAGIKNRAEKYGRFIFEFNVAFCGGAKLWKRKTDVGVVNVPLPLFGINHPSYGSQPTHYFSIGDFVHPNEAIVYDSSIDYGLSIRNYNGCQDTFRFEIKTVCDVNVFSVGLGNGNIELAQRHFPATWTIGNDFYVGLGAYGSHQFPLVRNDLWRFNGDSQTWEELAPLPSVGRSEPAICRIDQKLYIIGGSDAVKAGYHTSNIRYDEMWVYDIPTNSWAQLPSYPGGLFSGGFAFAHNGLIYVGSGKTGNQLGSFSGLFYCYNPETSSWNQLSNYGSPQFNQAVKNAVAIVVGDTAIVLGGDVRDPDCGVCVDGNPKMYGYNIATNSWFLWGAGYSTGGYAPSNSVSAFGKKDNFIYWQRRSSTNVLGYDLDNKSFVDFGSFITDSLCIYADMEPCETTVAGSSSDSIFYILTQTKEVSENSTVFNHHRLKKFDMSDLLCSNPQYLNNTIESDGNNQVCGGDTVIAHFPNGYEGISLQWFKNGLAIEGAISDSLFITQSGIYHVVHYLSGGSITSNAITIVHGPECPCIGDFNHDGHVNSLDMQIMIGEFGCLEGCITDLNNDSIVGVADLLILNSLLGQVCD